MGSIPTTGTMRGDADCGHCCLDVYTHDSFREQYVYNVVCVHCHTHGIMPKTWQITQRMLVEEHRPIWEMF